MKKNFLDYNFMPPPLSAGGVIFLGCVYLDSQFSLKGPIDSPHGLGNDLSLKRQQAIT